jgi:hypothetical protein
MPHCMLDGGQGGQLVRATRGLWRRPGR